MCAHSCGGQRTAAKSVLFFHCVAPRDRAAVGGGGLGVAASPLSAETSLRPFKSHLPPPRPRALCCFYMGSMC